MPVILAFSGWKGKLVLWYGLHSLAKRARSGWFLGLIPVIMAKAGGKKN
jgi:hypothetical protein